MAPPELLDPFHDDWAFWPSDRDPDAGRRRPSFGSGAPAQPQAHAMDKDAASVAGTTMAAAGAEWPIDSAAADAAAAAASRQPQDDGASADSDEDSGDSDDSDDPLAGGAGAAEADCPLVDAAAAAADGERGPAPAETESWLD